MRTLYPHPGCINPLARARAGFWIGAAVLLAFSVLTVAADPAPPDASSDWVRREYAGISAELPGEMKSMPLPIPEAAKALISKSESFAYFEPGWEIGVTHTVYKEIDAKVTGAINGSIESVKKLPGVTGYTSEITDATLDGVPAKKVTAKFQRLSADIVTVTLVAGQGHDLWTITIAGPALRAGEVAARIFESAKWKR
jgi:hypothetical protein